MMGDDDEEEMTRAEMATYMAGMLEQWQKEDAERFKQKKDAAAQAEKQNPNKDGAASDGDHSEGSKDDSFEGVQEDDNDDDFEDCDDGEEGMANIEGRPIVSHDELEYLDEDEELLDECEFSSQDFNMAFIQAMNDNKKAYPEGW